MHMKMFSLTKRKGENMEKKIFKRISAGLIALVVAFSMLYISVSYVNAASGVYTGLSDVMWVGEKADFGAREKPDSKHEVIKVSSSDPTVLKVNYNKGDEDAVAKAKKAGKATLTVVYRIDDQPPTTLTQKIKVKKYPNEIRKMTINGKAVKISNHKFHVSKKCTTTTPEVKIKLKKGWKIKSVDAQANDYKNPKIKKIKITKSMLTKGKSFSFPKRYGQMFINIVMINQKGEAIKYSIDLHR